MGLAGGQRHQIQKLNSIRLNSSVLGVVKPILFGQGRLSARLIWYGDFTANKAKQQGGKGLSKGGTQYVYTASIIAALAQGPLKALLNVWDSSGRFVLQSTAETTTVPGTGVFNPTNQPMFGNDQGVGLQTAYSVGPFTDFGSPAPVTLSGNQNVPMVPVAYTGTQVADPMTNFLNSAWNMNYGTFTVDTIANGVQLATQGGGDHRAVMGWSGITVPAAMFAQITLDAVDANTGSGLGPAVNVAASGETFYGFYLGGSTGTAFLFKLNAGTLTVISSLGGQTVAVGDVLRLENDGSGNLKAYKNGTLMLSGTDVVLTGGTVGIQGITAGSAWRAINFSGGGTAGPTLTTGQYSVSPIGNYFFSAADAGKTITVNYAFYRYKITTQQIGIVPLSGPFTVIVDNSANYKSDLGVQFYPSGTALTKVGGSPTTGQYSQSGGTYTFAAADTGLGIIITYEYNDPNTDTNAPSTLNLTLVSGTLGQAPLSYMTSKHPSQALGYSQLAYLFSSGLYLGFTPELPNYNYEVAGDFQVGSGILDASPSDCIISLLTDQGFGLGFPQVFLGDLTNADNCWTANGFFISPVIENADSCSSIIAGWLEAGMTAGFWSEAQLKFVPYSDTTAVGNGATYSPSTNPVASLTDDDLLTNGPEDSISIARSPWQDAWNQVRIVYDARVNDYNPEPISEQDEAGIQRFGLRAEDPKRWDFIKIISAAQFAASMRVQRAAYIRNTYSFRLPTRFSYLEPMDVVTLTNIDMGLSATPVRITKIEDDFEAGLDITAEDFIWGTAQPAYNPKGVNTPYIPEASQADPGNTNAIVFEAPNRLGLMAGNVLYGFVNGSNPNWGGCHVWVSSDGTNYSLLETINTPGRIGNLTATLASYGGANPDNTNTLSVKMNVPGSTLPAASASDASNFVSLCAIVNASNAVELLSYQNSVLAGADLYNLTTLYRGLYGTTASSHLSTELFARLDEASFIKQYDPTFYGKTLYFKFTSFNLLGNQEQSLANVAAFPLAIVGTGKGAVALDTGYLNIAAPGYTAYRPLTNPLTAHDAGSNVTINIASFNMQLAGVASPIAYNSGSITALSYNTLYYIYFDDVAEVGGTVTYNATTTKETAFNGVNRFFVGSIQTPPAGTPDTNGNNDGGNSAQYGMLTKIGMIISTSQGIPGFATGSGANLTQANGAGSTLTNPNNAVDGDLTTLASLITSGNSTNNNCVLYAAPLAPFNRKWTSLTLCVRWAIVTNTLNGSSPTAPDFQAGGAALGYYSLYGSGPNAIIGGQKVSGAGGTTSAIQTSRLSLPVNTNLAQFLFWANTSAFLALGQTTGSIELDIYDVWVEGVE